MTYTDREEALAKALMSRMTWPSMHWHTQSLDFDAAVALAKVAIDEAATGIRKQIEREVCEAIVSNPPMTGDPIDWIALITTTLIDARGAKL